MKLKAGLSNSGHEEASDFPAFPNFNTSMNASTMRGSNCFPRPATSVSMAISGVSALRYGRFDVIASNTSATLNILAPNGISSPLMPSGYPLPS